MQNSKKDVILITGGIGSGKSEVLDILHDIYDAQIIRADDIAKDMYDIDSKCYHKIIDILGDKILLPDRNIDKNKMADMIFADDTKADEIDDIIHPIVWDKIKDIIDESDKDFIVVEAALPRDCPRDMIDKICYVSVPDDIRARRLRDSRGYSDHKIRSIMNRQMSDREYRQIADIIIDNDSSIDALRANICKMMKDRKSENR